MFYFFQGFRIFLHCFLVSLEQEVEHGEAEEQWPFAFDVLEDSQLKGLVIQTTWILTDSTAVNAWQAILKRLNANLFGRLVPIPQESLESIAALQLLLDGCARVSNQLRIVYGESREAYDRQQSSIHFLRI